MSRIESKEVELIVKTLDDHKAEDIKVIDVSSINPFASHVIIATILNVRALGAMEDILEDALNGFGIEQIKKDGNPESGWIVIAGEEAIIHLFLSVNRKEVGLEALLERAQPKKA